MISHLAAVIPLTDNAPDKDIIDYLFAKSDLKTLPVWPLQQQRLEQAKQLLKGIRGDRRNCLVVQVQ